MEGIIGIILLIGFIMAGMPIGFAMAVSGCIGLGLAGGLDAIISVLSTSPFRTTASFVMTTLPMFILMAEIASSGGLAGDLFELGRRWIGHIPGGLGIATTLASAGFGAMSGSANACAATMSRIAIPEMLKVGYHKRLASAVVAIAGTLDPDDPTQHFNGHLRDHDGDGNWKAPDRRDYSGHYHGNLILRRNRHLGKSEAGDGQVHPEIHMEGKV